MKFKNSQETSMPPAGFEPEIPASERRPHAHASDRAAIGFSTVGFIACYFVFPTT